VINSDMEKFGEDNQNNTISTLKIIFALQKHPLPPFHPL